ncbi:hypothetical protein [Cupriavidus gilardii]|uniref:hypothetical protein n=1 Tax=Cupriavidus gilardii TaxID=82541 RepID=UPI0021B3F0EC|nr:hypothetical protein [Cupriavidus gilardii]UXC37103.1 hypothetical protein N4G38_06540 [Cupriavidus gilardii]
MAELLSIEAARERRAARQSTEEVDHENQPRNSILITFRRDGLAYSLRGIPASSRRQAMTALVKVLNEVMGD